MIMATTTTKTMMMIMIVTTKTTTCPLQLHYTGITVTLGPLDIPLGHNIDNGKRALMFSNTFLFFLLQHFLNESCTAIVTQPTYRSPFWFYRRQRRLIFFYLKIRRVRDSCFYRVNPWYYNTEYFKLTKSCISTVSKPAYRCSYKSVNVKSVAPLYLDVGVPVTTFITPVKAHFAVNDLSNPTWMRSA